MIRAGISLILTLAPLVWAESQEPRLERTEAAETAPQETQAGSPAPAAPAAPAKGTGGDANDVEQFYGVYAPGRGFTLARTEEGEANLSLYFKFRYLNQNAVQGTWTDHFGNRRDLSQGLRNDFQVNRFLLMFSGWIYDPKFRYFTYVWTSNANIGRETQILVGGNLGYHFSDAFSLFAGIGPMPGVRSNQNVWPYFHGTDRRIADEFFRPAYTQGIWAAGNPLPRFYYQAMVGNNLSLLGIDASQLDRKFSYSGAVWWLPTTGEFGPRGSYSDYEIHDKLATRFGAAFTFSPEDRQSQPDPLSASENTVIRLSDGLVAFEEGALAPGVTVDQLNFKLVSASAGLKIRGYALSGEYYGRWLTNFRANGPLPVNRLFDHGFQIQTSYQVWPKHIEAYGGTSFILGHFDDSWEGAGGLNWYPWKTRNARLNGEVIYVHNSPTGSLYTPYVVGQTGLTFFVNLELFF